MSFILFSQHGVGREVRTLAFEDFDEAVDFAKANDPDADPSLCPQVDEDLARTFGTYEKGLFWASVENKYAIILNTNNNQES